MGVLECGVTADYTNTAVSASLDDREYCCALVITVYVCYTQRPFVVERHTSNEELYSQLRHTRPSASARWDQATCDVLKLVS